MAKKLFHYLTCCINSNARSIDEMVDRAREITATTFFRHVDEQEANEAILGSFGGSQMNPRLKDDYAVTFHSSKFRGKKCYYVRHSSVEFIFVA